MEEVVVAALQEQIQEAGFLKVLWKQEVGARQPQEDLMDVVEPKEKRRKSMLPQDWIKYLLFRCGLLSSAFSSLKRNNLNYLKSLHNKVI